MPRGDCNKLLLLRDLGGGGHGRAFEAATASGSVCVVKFGKKQTKEENVESITERLERERTLWHVLWRFSQVRVQQWGLDQALLMPFVKTVRKKDEAELYRSKVEASIKLIAQQHNKIHTDLKWHHVGVYRDNRNDEERVVLIDLGSMADIKDNNHLDAIQTMITALNKSYSDLD